ncbi:MAG: type II toxin-antitoxin system ParD family antitoxin [Mesorhizobium sp.]|nr:type II toxin-antitoxin system ParD family antitoxin [Mesorhizobium sp.]MCO5160870.1 type II toxin-antitoxin system ParD family antitoxin [Mesorhizobium sp.]
MRSSKPITVTLGKQQAILDRRLESGEFESASEVVRAGLRALEREERARNEVWRRLIQESLDDPRPDIPGEEVFAELEALHDERVKVGR